VHANLIVVLLSVPVRSVRPVSSLFDAPVQLLIVLATAIAGPDAVPPSAVSSAPVASPVTLTSEGPYAFSAPVWLNAVREGHGGTGLASYRSRIFVTSSGRLYVPVQSEARAIMKLRESPPVAAAVALDLARLHATQLSAALSRAPSVKDLYAAHRLGLDTAVRLARLRLAKPNALVSTALPDIATAFPEAAAWRGKPMTLAKFYDRLPDLAGGVLEAISARSDSREAPVALTYVPQVGAERSAPLRGLIAEVSGSSASARLAGMVPVAQLNWAARVERAP